MLGLDVLDKRCLFAMRIFFGGIHRSAFFVFLVKLSCGFGLGQCRKGSHALRLVTTKPFCTTESLKPPEVLQELAYP